MSLSCPHCRSPVALDPKTGVAPAVCPKCGATMTDAPATKTSEASTQPAKEKPRGGKPTTAVQTPAATTPRPGNVAPARPAAKSSRSAPSFLHRRRAAPATRRARLLTWGAVAVLALVLALQILLADRARLAADAGWRPAMTALCDALRCSLPPWREPIAFTMLRRDVHTHPTVSGALRISATFRNDARWPQPWPRLLLTLSDIDGRAVGARAFTSADYLEDAAQRPLLAPGQSATVTFDVREPAPRVVAFTFDFR